MHPDQDPHQAQWRNGKLMDDMFPSYTRMPNTTSPLSPSPVISSSSLPSEEAVIVGVGGLPHHNPPPSPALSASSSLSSTSTIKAFDSDIPRSPTPLPLRLAAAFSGKGDDVHEHGYDIVTVEKQRHHMSLAKDFVVVGEHTTTTTTTTSSSIDNGDSNSKNDDTTSYSHEREIERIDYDDEKAAGVAVIESSPLPLPLPPAALMPKVSRARSNFSTISAPPHPPAPFPPTLAKHPGSSSGSIADADADVDVDEFDYPEGGLRAWLVVLGAFCVMVCGFGIMNTVGTLQAYLATHQLSGYDPSTTGWIFSLYIFLAFFCGVQIGPVFDAKGPRWLILAGSLALVGGTFGLAESTEYWHFLLSFSIACGLGTSLLFTPSVSAIAHFFRVKRGEATGIATTGGSVGGIVFPLMLPALFDRYGWAWGVRTMGFIFIVLTAVGNLLIRARLPPRKGGSVWPDFSIFRSRTFSLTTAGVFAMEWGLFVPLAYLSSWAITTRVGASGSAASSNSGFAFQLLAILNVGSFFGRWLPGYIADRAGRFNTMIGAMGMCLVCILGLWLPGSLSPFTPSTGRGSVPLAVLFSLGFGFASGSGISLTPVCVGQLCRTDQYGRYYATCYTLVSLGCLTGVPIAGELLSRGGGEFGGLIAFTAACYAAGIACFVAARVGAVGWRVSAVY